MLHVNRYSTNLRLDGQFGIEINLVLFLKQLVHLKLHMLWHIQDVCFMRYGIQAV